MDWHPVKCSQCGEQVSSENATTVSGLSWCDKCYDAAGDYYEYLDDMRKAIPEQRAGAEA